MTVPSLARRRIAIIGSGFSGLCLGIKLKEAGMHDFTIYEKEDRVGGTWRDNSYPGAACDLPSMAYCFSFEQKTDWSRKWSPQPEIQEYMEHCARKYGLLPHVRFRTEIASAAFDESAGVWRLATASGEQIEAEVLVCAVGQLNRPYVPEIPGLESFAGERFHSARWNHAYDLGGKRVAVVGNAASAIQFIPEIAREVGLLSVFQRSANWLLPRNDRSYSEREKWLFANVPGIAKLYRWWIWLSFEIRFPAFLGNRFIAEQTRKFAEQYIRDVVPDPKMRAALVPDYPVGGKRILISDDYYQALVRPNVELETSGIDHVESDGIVTQDGVKHACDALVFATGFESTRFLAPMRITGRGGRSLDDDWREGARAYRGITVSGYPNLFLMYGPNTNLGHNSIIFMIECQTGYILQAIRTLIDRDLAFLDVKPEVQQAFDTQTQRELSRTVWARTPHSWYKTESGRITNNWSGTTTRYWWGTRRFDAESYASVARAAISARAAGERNAADAA